ncbi:amino acid transporter [Aureobasidium pullulans]|nr:amino acid transporter [Aureobasidium pullulans]TIA04751.1 amino acid transporter [Aureobasidium pullulans]
MYRGPFVAMQSVVNERNDEQVNSGTEADVRDMRRMGKQQELNRNFKGWGALFGFSLILGNAWVVCMVTSIFGLTNGGTAGTIWMFIVVACGMFCSTLSMAEMASMVSEFSPPKHQKYLSFLTAMSASAYTPALTIQGLIALSDETYTLPGWHAFLLTLAILFISIVINITMIRKLPMLEGLMIVIFFCSFGNILIVLWVKGEKSSAEDVFTKFSDNAGWGSVGLATLIGGLQGGFSSLMGSDSAAHLSEELKDASYYLPRSMVYTALANYTTGIVTIITLMFTLGGSAEELTSTRLGQPYIQVFYNATKSVTGASVITALIALLLIFTAINQVTTTSRQLYAFARDGGMPYSGFIGRVHPKWNLPINSLIVTLLFTFMIAFIIIGSSVPFNIITTLSSASLLTSYIICTGCMLWKRTCDKANLPKGRFDLGCCGRYINCAALLFQIVIFVVLFFPSMPHPTASSMNWTILIYGVTFTGSTIYYFLTARHQYLGPVEHIEKD